MKRKAIIDQIKRMFVGGYPSAYIPVRQWSWKMTKKGVRYNHGKTLMNFLNKEKAAKWVR